MIGRFTCLISMADTCYMKLYFSYFNTGLYLIRILHVSSLLMLMLNGYVIKQKKKQNHA